MSDEEQQKIVRQYKDLIDRNIAGWRRLNLSELRRTDHPELGLSLPFYRELWLQFNKHMEFLLIQFCRESLMVEESYRDVLSNWADQLLNACEFHPEGFFRDPILRNVTVWHGVILTNMEEEIYKYKIDSPKYCEEIILSQRELATPEPEIIERAIDATCRIVEYWAGRTNVAEVMTYYNRDYDEGEFKRDPELTAAIQQTLIDLQTQNYRLDDDPDEFAL